MALISQTPPAERLYLAVSKAFAPNHPDPAPEKAAAVALLKEASDAGVSEEMLVQGALSARVNQGEFRGKLGNFIQTRYWEHLAHAKVIRGRAYEPSAPRTNLDNVDLTP